MAAQFVLGFSILVQATAALLAVRLNWLYGRRWAWTIISAAIVLMTLRRCLTFFRMISDVTPGKTAWFDESSTYLTSAVLSLVVSTLLLFGVALIYPIFRRIREAESILSRENRRLEGIVSVNEAEFQLARQVQHQLYPDEDPKVEGLDISGRSIPARSASGDYFDYLPSSGGALGIVIGDASGHGMGAALLATETRAYLHAAWESHDDPAEILTVTNRFLCDDTTGGQFVTLLIMRVDLRRHEIILASAGHPAFLLPKSGEVETWQGDGIPLGIDRDELYTSLPEHHLDTGDILLLCSDGLWEAQAPNNSLFGMQRTLEIVRTHREKSAREIVDLLFQAAEQFTGRSLPEDDITIIVVKA